MGDVADALVRATSDRWVIFPSSFLCAVNLWVLQFHDFQRLIAFAFCVQDHEGEGGDGRRKNTVCESFYY